MRQPFIHQPFILSRNACQVLLGARPALGPVRDTETSSCGPRARGAHGPPQTGGRLRPAALRSASGLPSSLLGECPGDEGAKERGNQEPVRAVQFACEAVSGERGEFVTSEQDTLADGDQSLAPVASFLCGKKKLPGHWARPEGGSVQTR